MILERIAQMRTGGRRDVMDFCLPPAVPFIVARPPPRPSRQVSYRSDSRKGPAPMAVNETTESLVNVLRDTIVSLVRQDGPDLSARQFGVFLTCYLESDAQTVRGLAATLDVSKPVISRALDRLADFDLVRRKADPTDRRSVLVQRTPAGTAYLKDIRGILRDAAAGKTRR